MHNLKISIAIILTVTAVSFAQVADTSSKQATLNKAVESSSLYSSQPTTTGKDLAKITPASKTNWSKIKDLFL